jgi:Concanavalin A-like lectin/glucanases superfamily
VADSFLILVPLLVLAVVLLLGFAGCRFEHGVLTGDLLFRARVPPELTVDGGVTFSWKRPNAAPETVTVTFAEGPSLARYITAMLNLFPALLWTLGDVDGVVDRTGKGRDGQPVGGVTVGGQQDGPTVFDSTATHFDGVDDRITSPYSPFLGTSGRTFVGWTRRDSNSSSDLLFGSSAAAGADQARLYLPSNENVRFEPNGGDGQNVVWNNAWPGNAQWVWWALRFDQGGNAVSLFINGNLVSTQSCTDTWPTAAGNFQVGAAGTTNMPLGGDSALIAVYEKLLGDAALMTLYQVSQEMVDVVYEHKVAASTAGTWFGRCGMTVHRHGQVGTYETADSSFMVVVGESYRLTFQAVGAPGGPTPFAIVEPPQYVKDE